MKKKRIPRKKKKTLKKRYSMLTDYVGKTTITSIDNDGVWITPVNATKIIKL